MSNICKAKILIGNHGSGKSKYIYDYFYLNATKDTISKDNKKIKTLDLNKKLYLVVPEQDTAEKQKIIMERFADFGYGMLNVDVISFDRMAHMVFSILDIEPKKEKIIDDDVKSIILKKCIININKKKKLKYFSKIKDSIGFTKKLTSCMSEFYSYNITSDKIVKVLEKLDNDLLKSKLLELSYIYDEFRKELKNKEFIIKEDKLNLLLENIGRVHIFDNAIIAFDGFTGFVPLQKNIFDKLLDVASEVLVSVDYRMEEDFNENTFGSNLKINDLFFLSEEFVNLIIEVSTKKNIKIEYIKFKEKPEYKFKNREDLRYVEQNIFKYKKYKENDIEPNNILLYKSNNTEEEVKNLTNIIERLIRKEDYNYNDIKVIVPDIEKYRNNIIGEFKKNNIPLFIDDSENIYTSPYIETIRAAFEVLKYRFSYDSVLRYINSGLFEKNENLYELDNFIRKYGIRGYLRYKNGFEKIKKVTNNILEIKNDILKPLVDFYESLSNEKYYKIILKHTMEDYIKNLKKFISDIKLDERYKKFLENVNKNYDLSIKDIKILEKSFDVLNYTIENLMLLNDEDEVLSIDDIKNLIDIGFENVKIKSIPFSMDQIVVGDLMRSRFDNPKVCILIGMNQSEVPKSTVDTNLIDDEIRDIFSKENIELSQTSKETALNQRFYLYLALTCAKEKMIISSSNKNALGETDEDAYIIDDIKNMFLRKLEENQYETKIKTISINNNIIYTKKEALDFIINNYKSLEYFIFDENTNKENIANINDEIIKNAYITLKLIKNLKNNNIGINFDEYYQNILNINFGYKDSKLNIELINDLIKTKYSKDLIMSSTSIEEFNSCPYKYFLDKTLELKIRENFEIKNYDIGDLFHKSLEYFFKNLNKNFKDFSDEELVKRIDDAISIAFTDLEKFETLDNKESDFFGINELEFLKNRLKTILETTIKIIRQDAKISELKNFKTEENFNYVINNNENITGRIDRIDTLIDNNNLYIKVIDYKSSNKVIKISDIESGVNIQLMLYLDYLIDNIKDKYEIKNVDNIIPCGAYYLSIESAPITVDLYKDFNNRKNLIYENKNFSGIFNSEEDAYKKIFSENSSLGKSKIVIEDEKLKGVAEGVVIDTAEISNYRNTVKNKIRETINEIKSGNIKIKPYNDKICGYCQFADMCKKDFSIDDGDDKE